MKNDIVSVTGDFQGLVLQEDIERYPELLVCLRYLILKNSSPKLSMEQITDMLNTEFSSFPTTRPGAYYRIELWRQNGTLRRAESLYLPAKIEEIRAAIDRGVEAIPKIVDRLIEDAINGKSGKNALDVANFLIQLTEAKLDESAHPGDMEKAFARKTRSFNPLSIVEGSDE